MELNEVTYTDAEAMERLRKDVIAMLFIEPFFAAIIANTKKVIGTNVHVAGVAIIDGEMVLFINVKGYFSYPLYERLFILIHEVLHLVLFHPTRENNRVHKWWNMATDIAINQMIENKKAIMPVDCLKVDTWEKSHGIVFPKNLDADQYYILLKELNKELAVTDEMKQGAMGQRLAEPSPSESSSPKQEESQDESNLQNHHGLPSNESDESSNSIKEQESPFDNMHPTWKESNDASKEVTETVIRKAIEEAYTHANGNVPANLRTYVNDVLLSKTNWRGIFRNFIAKKRTTNKKSTWKKRNRRLGSAVMGYKKTRKLTVLVGVDTSASISEENYRNFNGELKNMAKSGADIVIAECDTNVHSIYKYQPTKTPSFIGGGGTDFRPVFDLANNHNHKLLSEKPDVIVFLTDGAGPAPTSSSISTLWCLTPNGRIPFSVGIDEIKWGKIIYMNS